MRHSAPKEPGDQDLPEVEVLRNQHIPAVCPPAQGASLFVAPGGFNPQQSLFMRKGPQNISLLLLGALVVFSACLAPQLANKYGSQCNAWLKECIRGWRHHGICNTTQQDLPSGVVEVVAHDTQGLADKEVCHLQGFVDECCGNCTYQAVDRVNQKLNPILSQLVKLPFFRYFKVNLWSDCFLWPDDSMCMMRECSVCECQPHEVPKPWQAWECESQPPGAGSDGSGASAPEDDCDTSLSAAEADAVVNRTVSPSMANVLKHMRGWRGHNNPWMAEGDEDEEYIYVDLLANPERYTGYKGEHAHRIWSAIYSQDCLSGPLDCDEKRVFFRLLSGMHASISTHIAAKYLLDEERSRWGPSLEEFTRRLGHPAVRYRVQNLYFSYLFVLRAVMKAGVLMEGFTYTTGNPEDDSTTAHLIRALVHDEHVQGACPVPFDEGRLLRGEAGPALMHQWQTAFRNLTRIMDCVGCEKCKLWGKLQTLGIATALKILFSTSDCQGLTPTDGDPGAQLSLERNEVIALVNLLERFSSSLQYYTSMSAQLDPSTRAVQTADSIL